MKYIGSKNNISIQISNWKNYFHTLFYTINEEIVLGAIGLFILVKVKKIRPLLASILLVVAFSLIHFIFYQWIFDDRDTIHLFAVITLFLIAFVRNNLILSYGHIGYSWALHFGWIAIMLACHHLHTENQVRLT